MKFRKNTNNIWKLEEIFDEVYGKKKYLKSHYIIWTKWKVYTSICIAIKFHIKINVESVQATQINSNTYKRKYFML